MNIYTNKINEGVITIVVMGNGNKSVDSNLIRSISERASLRKDSKWKIEKLKRQERYRRECREELDNSEHFELLSRKTKTELLSIFQFPNKYDDKYIEAALYLLDSLNSLGSDENVKKKINSYGEHIREREEVEGKGGLLKKLLEGS